MEKGAVIKHDIQKAPKTGEWRYMKPKVLEEKCTACKVCIPFCPEAAIDLKTQNPKPEASKKGYRLQAAGYVNIDYEFCKGCGVCSDVCPERAIIMTKNDSK